MLFMKPAMILLLNMILSYSRFFITKYIFLKFLLYKKAIMLILPKKVQYQNQFYPFNLALPGPECIVTVLVTEPECSGVMPEPEAARPEPAHHAPSVRGQAGHTDSVRLNSLNSDFKCRHALRSQYASSASLVCGQNKEM